MRYAMQRRRRRTTTGAGHFTTSARSPHSHLPSDTMRPLLLLALLSCLLAAQLAAATRDTFTTGRALLKKPLKKRVATPVNLTRQQFVQATWALQDVTCAGVYATAKDKNFNNTLALAVTRDFMDVLNAAGWPAAALSVRVVRQPCKDITYNNKTYASFRAGVRFNSTTDTQVRDDMWAAVADPDTASPCTGGYNTTLYKNVAALFAKYSLKVSQNNGTRTNMFYNGTDAYWVEYAGPCLPKPKPIIKAIVVDTPIIGTSCDPADVEALANGVRATITSGLPPAESALVFVEVIDCKPTATGRRLLASNVTVTLSITTSPLLTTAAQVDAASRALYAAITGKPSSSLPAGASLDTVLQMLNTDLKDGGAADLLVKVQTAIVAANLTAVFDATLTNATQVAGTQQAITCPNMPEFTGASFSTQCLGQIPGFDCVGSCANGGTVTATCSTAGTWTIPATASCPAEQQPKKECTGVPSTTPEGGAWPTAGCAGLARCDATCSGDATGSPFAVCDTVTGAWSGVSGSCTPIRCLDSPLFGIAYANWATNCGTTVGSTCTATCVGAGQATIATCARVPGTTTANWNLTTPGNCASGFPANATCSNTNGAASGQLAFVCGFGFASKTSAAGSSIATLDAAAAKAICCDAIYPADATCATSWTASCPAGSTPNPFGLINGLVVGSTAAQSICCSGGAAEVSPSPTPPSPSPPPCVPTCSDSTVGQGVPCGTTSNGCGGTCTATCTIFGASSATCSGGVCTCNPTCSGSASNLPVGAACGLDSNGCGSFCSRNCAAGSVCNSSFVCECVPTCNATISVGLNDPCTPLSNSCGGTCPRQCAAGTFCNSASVCQCSPTCTDDLAVTPGNFCGQQPDGCGSFCTKTCASTSDCLGSKCQAKTAVTVVNSITPLDASMANNLPTNQWLMAPDATTTATAPYECAIVDLASQPTNSGTDNPYFNNNLKTQPSFTNPSVLMTKAFKMVTKSGSDKCEAMIAFPGNNGEARGLFNGMPFKDFLTTGGTIEWKWYKGVIAGGSNAPAPSLKLAVADPAAWPWTFIYSGRNAFVYFSMEPYCQKPSITSGENGCSIPLDVNTWSGNLVSNTQSAAWIGPNWSMGANQTICGGGHYSLQWWMQPATSASPRTFAGGSTATNPCDYRLKYDSANAPYPVGTPPFSVTQGFMDRAVILSIHMQLGSGPSSAAGFVGWLQIKTGAGAAVQYDYTWEFGG
uniref:Uncharacterized protein n=1 Tax=Tetradesmus obliquus TaxID=3088 RepID=A0A383V5R8_TETOB